MLDRGHSGANRIGLPRCDGWVGRWSDRLSLAGDELGIWGAQGDWADLKGSNTSAVGTFAGLPFSNQTKIDSLGLFSGQVGYAWNNVLLYVKGGAAFTHDKYSAVTNFTAGGVPVGTVFVQASETRWGSVVGTGLEFGFAPGWSVAVSTTISSRVTAASTSLLLLLPVAVFSSPTPSSRTWTWARSG